MLFKPELAQKILRGEKTQTRRVVKPGEGLEFHIAQNGGELKAVYNNRGLKWIVGQTYAIQPGRGKAAIGRFRLLDIRQEIAKDISEADAIAEGVDRNCVGNWQSCPSCRSAGKCQFDDEYRHYLRGDEDEPAYSAAESFLSLLESINGKGSLDKEVWVLTFEVAERKGD